MKSNLLEDMLTIVFFIALGYILTIFFGVSMGNNDDLIHSEISIFYDKVYNHIIY